MMLNREKLLKFIADAEERACMTRILDLAERVLTKHEVAVSDFLEPRYTGLAKDILRGLPDLKFVFEGGHGEAERQRIVLFPGYLEPEDLKPQIGILKITGGRKFTALKHRDFLGALLGLGIRREKIGDILIGEQYCLTVVAQELTSYIAANLRQVGNVPVQVAPLSEIEPQFGREENFKQIKTTVASLRLDAVSSHGFSLSRSQMLEEIKDGKVKLNWKETTDPAKPVQKGDTISCRGRGRLIVEDVTGATKKGRVGIVLKRLL
jgi:RNA-binding protein YlmH